MAKRSTNQGTTKGTKRGYKKCPTCSRSFKNATALAKHKCNKKEPMNCPVCHKEQLPWKFESHYMSCQFYFFKKSMWPFLVFFCRLISSFNLRLRTINFMGYASDKKRYIKRYMRNVLHTVFAPTAKEKRDIIKQAVLRRYGKALEDVRSPEYRRFPAIKFWALVDAKYDLFPSLSKRQYIYDYLDKLNIHNKKIRRFIHKRLYFKDYMTDQEMKDDMPKVYDQIQKLRVIYDYSDTRMQFEGILDKYINDKDSLQCPYCKSYIQEKKKHIKYCQEAINDFNMDKEAFIKSYIRANFDVAELKDGEEEDAIFYFKGKDFKTFTSYIGRYFRSHKATLEAIENKEYATKKTKVKSLGAFDKRKFLDDFKAEFDQYMKENPIKDEEKPKEDQKKDENADENTEEIETNIISYNNENNMKNNMILIEETPKKESPTINEEKDYKISETTQKYMKSIKFNPNRKEKKNKFISHL